MAEREQDERRGETYMTCLERRLGPGNKSEQKRKIDTFIFESFLGIIMTASLITIRISLLKFKAVCVCVCL